MSHDKNSQMRCLIRATLQKNFLCVLNLTACVIFLGLINGVAYTEALRRMTQAVWEREWSGFLHALCGFGAVLLCSLILNIGKRRKTERIGPQPGSIRAVLFLWNRAADSEKTAMKLEETGFSCWQKARDAGLPPAQGRRMMERLLRASDTAVVVTHRHEYQDLFDRVVVVRDGRIRQSGQEIYDCFME